MSFDQSDITIVTETPDVGDDLISRTNVICIHGKEAQQLVFNWREVASSTVHAYLTADRIDMDRADGEG